MVATLETARTHHAPPFADAHKRVERMVFFSDAVFAIAITLLALEIKVPHFEGEFEWGRLEGILPALVAYATSYAVIGISWWAHIRISQRLINVNGQFIALNLLRLFFIAVIPFPTTMLMEHGGSAESWMFYAFVMAVSSLTEFLVWVYAQSNPLLTGTLGRSLKISSTLKLALTPVAFVISAIMAKCAGFDAGWISLSVLLMVAQPLLERLITRRIGPD